MKHFKLTLAVLALTALLAACKDDPLADQVAGEYLCHVEAYTQIGGKDTTIVSNQERLVISRVDDQTVNIAMQSHRWGEGSFADVRLEDLGESATLAGEGTFLVSGRSSANPASLNGTYSLETGHFAISANVKNYSPRLIVSFTK